MASRSCDAHTVGRVGGVYGMETWTGVMLEAKQECLTQRVKRIKGILFYSLE